jgi:hypothetical protein
MDMLHQGRIDGFCLVSSDSDFTRLASRAREQGMMVYGFGAEKTPEAFRNACNRFIYIENLGVSKRESDEAPSAGKGTASSRKSAGDAAPLIRKAMDQMGDDDGWYNLGILGQTLGKLYPDFDPRTYGNAKLSTLVRKTGAFADRKGADGAIEIKAK